MDDKVVGCAVDEGALMFAVSPCCLFRLLLLSSFNFVGYSCKPSPSMVGFFHSLALEIILNMMCSKRGMQGRMRGFTRITDKIKRTEQQESKQTARGNSKH